LRKLVANLCEDFRPNAFEFAGTGAEEAESVFGRQSVGRTVIRIVNFVLPFAIVGSLWIKPP